MRAFLAIHIVCAAIAIAACQGSAPESTSAAAAPRPDSPYVKVWISSAGDVELNGKPATLEVVESSLVELAKKKGIVLYGREAATQAPHPNAMKVIQLVAASRLPIQMSTQHDFSDAVGADGKLKAAVP